MALKTKGNYTMAQGMKYIKSAKKRNILLGIVGIPFPFIPPFYLGFDPRAHSHEMFYLYLVVYFVFYFTFLGFCTDKPRKVQKVIGEKAILLGCPVEIKEMGAKGSNTYSATVKVNEAMFSLLKDIHVEDSTEFQEEDLALQEPFPHLYPIGSGVSGKFIDKNIPHYDLARKMGEYPQPVSSQPLEESLDDTTEESPEAQVTVDASEDTNPPQPEENTNDSSTSSEGD